MSVVRKFAQLRMVALIGVLAVVLAAGWAVAGLWPGRQVSAAKAKPVITEKSRNSASLLKGTGLPLPRFVSLKNTRTNVRRGPNSSYPIAWEFNRRGLPVEITREYENWRQIRDSEGAEGWIFQGMLTSHRSVLVAPWDRDSGTLKTLYQEPRTASTVVARLEPRVLASVKQCNAGWCSIQAGKVRGWVPQGDLWGVYPKEIIE
ncbi:MAG: SH3 domain-containing protein [Hyphomicrobiales bacterium]